MQYQPWMFDASQWHHTPCPYKAWHGLAYHVIAFSDTRKASEPQIRFFDYTFAMMLQRNTGWN